MNDPAGAKSARELLEKAAAATKEKQATAYFNHWKSNLHWREQYDKGDWVELTFDRGLSMWQMNRGTWTYENPKSVVGEPASLRPVFNFMSLICEVPFQAPLEIELDVAQLDGARLDGGYAYSSGVMIGDVWNEPDPHTGCYFNISPKNNAHGVFIPKLKIHHYVADTQPADHLRIQIWEGAYLYYFNELEYPIQPTTGMTPGDSLELVIAKSLGNIGKTRFANIRVRKLNAPPPPMEEGADRLEYFNGLVAEHPQDGFPYYQRGLWRASRKQWPEAEADLKKAMSLSNDIPQAYMALNNVERSLGNFAAAVEEVDRYLAIRPDDMKAHNFQAYILATCRDDKIRNGKLAVEHARKACELIKYSDFAYLDTLAAAFAENGDFDEAVKWQTKALEIAFEPMKPSLKAKIELYKSKSPVASNEIPKRSAQNLLQSFIRIAIMKPVGVFATIRCWSQTLIGSPEHPIKPPQFGTRFSMR